MQSNNVSTFLFPEGSDAEDTLSSLSSALGFLSHVAGNQDFQDMVSSTDDKEGFSALLDVTAGSVKHAMNQVQEVRNECRQAIADKEAQQEKLKPFVESLYQNRERSLLASKIFTHQYSDPDELFKDSMLYIHSTTLSQKLASDLGFSLSDKFIQAEKKRVLKKANKVKQALAKQHN